MYLRTGLNNGLESDLDRVNRDTRRVDVALMTRLRLLSSLFHTTRRTRSLVHAKQTDRLTERPVFMADLIIVLVTDCAFAMC